MKWRFIWPAIRDCFPPQLPAPHSLECCYVHQLESISEACGLVLGDWTSRINGDRAKKGLAEGHRDVPAELPPVNNTQYQVCFPPLQFTQVIVYSVQLHKEFSLHSQVNTPESFNQIPPPSADAQICITSASSSVYPCTSTVNPTIVLLQHNRGKASSLRRCIWEGFRVESCSRLHFWLVLFALCQHCVVSDQLASSCPALCYTRMSRLTVLSWSVLFLFCFLSQQSSKSTFLIPKVWELSLK